MHMRVANFIVHLTLSEGGEIGLENLWGKLTDFVMAKAYPVLDTVLPESWKEVDRPDKVLAAIWDAVQKEKARLWNEKPLEPVEQQKECL